MCALCVHMYACLCILCVHAYVLALRLCAPYASRFHVCARPAGTPVTTAHTQLVTAGTVLLKNDGPLLPLGAAVCRIVVIGDDGNLKQIPSVHGSGGNTNGRAGGGRHHLVLVGVGWHRLVSVGISWHRLMLVGISWHQLMSVGIEANTIRPWQWRQHESQGRGGVVGRMTSNNIQRHPTTSNNTQ